MEAIAEAAGVTKPVVYACYPGKEELFEALLRREEERVLGEIGAALPAAGDLDDPEAVLAEGFTAFLRAVADVARRLPRDLPRRGRRQRRRRAPRPARRARVQVDAVALARARLAASAAAATPTSTRDARLLGHSRRRRSPSRAPGRCSRSPRAGPRRRSAACSAASPSAASRRSPERRFRLG